jgi:hypothetical protein
MVGFCPVCNSELLKMQCCSVGFFCNACIPSHLVMTEIKYGMLILHFISLVNSVRL